MRKAVDISKWQDNNATPQKVDFAKMKAAGVELVIIRAAYGTEIDEDFRDYWRDAKAADIPRAAYFFLKWWAGSPSVASQVAFWVSLILEDPGEYQPEIDMERPDSSWPEMPGHDFLIDAIWQFHRAIKSTFPRFPRSTLYTNPACIHERLKPVPQWTLDQVDLHIAHYYQQAADIEPWTKWVIWQWGLGKGQGPSYGVESLDIDLDWLSDEFAGTTPQEDKPMGIYSKRAKVLYLWEAHTNVDFSKLKGKVDAIAVLLGTGNQPNVQAKATIKAAHAAGFPVLGYVELLPACYEGFAFKPEAFPKGESEPHVKMIHQALHWPDGTAEYVDGFIEDFSRHKMTDGKTWQTVAWNVAVAQHVFGEIWDGHKKPIYPLLKPFESNIPADYLNSGKEVATWLNALKRVSIVDTDGATVLENGVKVPTDLSAPVIPFISDYDYWWYGAQLLEGLNTAGVLLLFRDTPAMLYKELNVQGPGEVTPPNDNNNGDNGGTGDDQQDGGTISSADAKAICDRLDTIIAQNNTLLKWLPTSATVTIDLKQQ